MWDSCRTRPEYLHVSVQLSYRRIHRYLVLPLKAAEKHVTSSHVRFTVYGNIDASMLVSGVRIDFLVS